MFKKVLLFFLLVVQMFSAHAVDKHYLDSVQAVLDTARFTNTRLLCLYTLSFENGMTNPRKAIEQGWQCMVLAKTQKDTAYILNAYNALGNAYETLAEFDSAEYFHEKSYQLAVILRSKPKMISTLSNMANCNKLQGNYKAALEKFLMVYRLMEKVSVYNYRVHYTIADLYLKLGDYQKAVEHSQYGIYKINPKVDLAATLSLYLTLGKALFYSGKTDSAMVIINYTIDKLRQNLDEASLGSALNLLGEIYLTKKKYQWALQTFLEELPIEKRLQNTNGINLSQINIAYCHGLLKKDKKTIEALLNQIETYMKKHPPDGDIQPDVYKRLSDTYSLTGNSERALYYFKRYTSVNDSILNREKYRQIIDLQTQFESEKVKQLLRKQKAQLHLQAATIQKRKLLFVYLFITFLLMVGTGLLLYSKYKSKQKIKMLLVTQQQEKEMEQAVKEKETQERFRISKDIHDELGSGISKISIMAEYSKHQVNHPDEMKNTLDAIAKTSQKVADNMHDLVWSLNPENATLDNLAARIREYAGDYLEELPVEASFIFPGEIPAVSITKEFQRNVFLTCKEAINNVVKHASAKKIKIQVTCTGQTFGVEITDDGKGIKEENKHLSGNGLRNMQHRIESIGGTFVLTSNNGVTISISVPVGGNDA
ncbi:MAG: tetratricopeptide repeat protein [Bacteroidia bacterium]|nr:tetratricopeptide repeat protein [Ignavibacteria bacterium]MCZ2276407.1 tetratricopeptide repeat protein [Bacteroidia bacterium]